MLIAVELAIPNPYFAERLTDVLRQINFTDVVMNGMLAFLLFAGVLSLNLEALRHRAWPVGILAVFGTVVSTGLVGFAFWFAAKAIGQPLSVALALVFGALISPTDPVAVLSALKHARIPVSLEIEMQGEALLNDGVGVVLFTLLVGVASSGRTESVSVGSILRELLQEAGGGVLLGVAAGYLAYRALRSLDDYPIEVLITLALVAGTYALAQKLGTSGPLAVVAAGLVIGDRAPRDAMSDKTQKYVSVFWTVVDEVLNAVLFLLIGLEVAVLSFHPSTLLLGLCAVPLVLVARLIAVSAPVLVFRWGKQLSFRNVPFLTWAGIRGGISIALALALPGEAPRAAILTATYAVVVFTIIVQGATIGGVARLTVGKRNSNEAEESKSVSSPTNESGDILTARFRKLLAALLEAFWLLPSLMVVGGVLLAVGLVEFDRSGAVPQSLLHSAWLYSGAGTGARTLLGAVASSTIGVAGTVFSITIAALSLAAGQMGPRLLRNFTKDRGNQFTLGAFLGTFSYALMVLRSVRTNSEGEFVPHVSLSVGILLAFVCVATLVFFVGHMAELINVDQVVELVSADVGSAIERLTTDQPQPAPPDQAFWRDAEPLKDMRRGYLQQLDASGLADWAQERKTAIRMLVRPGDYVFPGASIAVMMPRREDAEAAILGATALGPQRASSADLEFAIRQLVEVAVRALSSGINDPYTAISVLDRLGAALCDLQPLFLTSGVHLRDHRPVLVVPAVTYDGLVDAMFHMIRQNASSSAAVLIHLLEVLTAVAACERNPERLDALERHADLALGDAERNVGTPADLADIRKRREAFELVRHQNALPARLT
jgi:uncharacterized membrane protein/NhaP-type Na+/H+ or K+/H+ antiporter